MPCDASGLEVPTAIQPFVESPDTSLPDGVALGRATNAFGAIFASGAARAAMIANGLAEQLFFPVLVAPAGEPAR